MDAFLWVLAVLLSVVFLAAGVPKLVRSKAELLESGQWFAPRLPEGVMRVAGVAEVAAAVGLVAPAVLGVAPVLVPVAASGIVLLEAGAAFVHAREGLYKLVTVNLTLAGLAFVVACQRFGPYAF
mgnify:CR=1 FL=1